MELFDWERAFGRTAPRLLDVGSGNGGFLLEAAALRPDRDHLGIELDPHHAAPGIAQAKALGLTNLRFVIGDAVEWLYERLSPSSLDELHLYHPQPYDDPEVSRRGLLTAELFERIWIVLRPGARIYLQSDHRACARYLYAVSERGFAREILSGPWTEAPVVRTRREAIALRKGLEVTRIQGVRRAVPLELPPVPPYFGGPARRRPTRSAKSKAAGQG